MQQNSQQQQITPQFTFEGGHLIMFHQEATGLPAVVDSNVNDRDRVTDLLATEKYLTHGYNVSMQEASHQQLFQVLKQNHDANVQIQRQLFNTAFKKGWYRLPIADAQAVATALTEAQKRSSEFPFKQGTTSQQFTQMMQQQNQQESQMLSQQGQQAQQGQQGQLQIKMGSQTATSGKTQTDQKLNQKVEQAIRQAQSGQVPSGMQAPVGGRISH